MRDLNNIEPEDMTYAEMHRAVAEAAAWMVFWAPRAPQDPEAMLHHKAWLARQARLEIVMTERYGR